MDKALEAVVEAVKSASPALWAAAEAKVRADLISAQIWSLFFGLMVFGLYVFALQRLWALHQERKTGEHYVDTDPYYIPAVASAVISVILWIPLGAFLQTWIQLSLAPNWYAIRALSQLSPLR